MQAVRAGKRRRRQRLGVAARRAHIASTLALIFISFRRAWVPGDSTIAAGAPWPEALLQLG